MTGFGVDFRVRKDFVAMGGARAAFGVTLFLKHSGNADARPDSGRPMERVVQAQLSAHRSFHRGRMCVRLLA